MVNDGLRVAVMADIPQITALIELSAREIGRTCYSNEQIEAALGSAWGVDRQLIEDRTYFVAETGAALIACGGWSRRKALFGSDAVTREAPGLLDPSQDAARIRAFFVHPGWARRGLARTLLARCEAEARAAGFRKAELVATLPGQPFYAALGYEAGEPLEYPLRAGLRIRFVPMKKDRLNREDENPTTQIKRPS